MLQHGTCVQYGGKGILLIGPSGSGKSDAALQLIEKGATLVADDQTEIRLENGRLVACCPLAIQGKIEARGLGIITVPFLPETRLDFVIECTPSDKIERMPLKAVFWIEGVPVLKFLLCPFEASFSAKVKALLTLDESFFA